MELVVDGLGKRYKNGVWGLRAFSMTLQPGLLGLIGPAGAGKTTLLRILATVTPPTEGTITWDGVDVRRDPRYLRRTLGYLPQHFGAYQHLSGRAFLLYAAALKGMGSREGRACVAELLARLGLSAAADDKIGRYSSEVRWRFGLAQALLNDPKLLLVDEPRASLGAQTRSTCAELLGACADHRIVIVTSDTASDVASLATAVALLKGGRLIAPDVERARQGQPYAPPTELVRSVYDRVWEVTVDQDAFVAIKRERLVSQMERDGKRIRLRIVSTRKPHLDAVLVEPTLDDACAYYLGAWE